MIKVTLTNEILSYITEIEQNRYKVSSVKLSKAVMNRLRKNSKKKSSYASNKIEGNPLSEKQVDEVIESDERKHYLALVIEQADNMQKSLEDSAKNDRSGRMSSIVRNHRVNSF